jgi:hypothetical protein
MLGPSLTALSESGALNKVRQARQTNLNRERGNTFGELITRTGDPEQDF